MKKIVVLLVVFALFFAAIPAKAAKFADVSGVALNNSVLIVTGTVSVNANAYAKIAKKGDVINVYIYQRGGCPSCGYGQPYALKINLKRYLSATNGRGRIYVNGVRFEVKQ